MSESVALYNAVRARPLPSLGEVEDAIYALWEREDLHDYSDGRDERICHCLLCQKVIPLLCDLAAALAPAAGRPA